MFSKLLPDMCAESIYDIDFDIFKEKGIDSLILDIDNTLVSHKIASPDEKTLKLLAFLKESGFKLAIISNGKPERVSLFTKGFDIPVISGHLKPSKTGYVLALQKMGSEPKACAAIGDQIFTDVLGANKMGIFSVFTTPIEKYENSFFYIKRFFEGFILKKLK
ncbi:MAG: YqeG family HAD IIIA-type phosphatase [Clostridia bacterium]|nr:YqeG family HAD IIIA-type phosphatase [Clostridia bacterium]